MASNTDTVSIPLLYRAFCLYVEPVLALGGTYLTYFEPVMFTQSTMPVAIFKASAGISPLNKAFLTQISGLYAFLAVNEALVLRLAPRPNVWRAVEFSMCLSDLAHLWAAYQGDPAVFLDPLNWRQDEWVNLGTLWVGFFIRVAIVLGIGFGSTQARKGKQH